MAGQYRVRNEGLIPYYEQVRNLLPSFDRFSVRHVPRAQNARADRLANAALDRRVAE
ncbi:MAG: reverse transcriptase-like protein [Dehalococcoidia bacterium]